MPLPAPLRAAAVLPLFLPLTSPRFRAAGGVTLPPPCELRPATELGPGGMDTATSAPGRPLLIAVLVETPAEQQALQ